MPGGHRGGPLWRYARAVPADPGVGDDVPVRLLGWAVGLLSAGRAEWGQAMLGELDHIEGRGRGGASPSAARAPRCCCRRGRAAAAVWAMAAVAAGAADLGASVIVRNRLGAGGWVFAVIMLRVPGSRRHKRLSWPQLEAKFARGPRQGPVNCKNDDKENQIGLRVKKHSIPRRVMDNSGSHRGCRNQLPGAHCA